MLFVTLERRDGELRPESPLDVFFEEVHIPLLPKIGVHANVNAMLVTAVVTMIVALWSDNKWNAQLYALTHLIPCFFIGVACGVASIFSGLIEFKFAAGRGFRVIRYPLLASISRSGKVWRSASLSLMLLSNLIFLASAGWGLYVMARAVGFG